MFDKFKKIWPILLIFAAMFAIYITGIYHYLSIDSLRMYHKIIRVFVELYPVTISILYCLVYVAVTALSIPGAVFLTLLGGYLFPQPLSTLYVLFSATCGAILIFLAAKTALKDSFRLKAGSFLDKMEAGFRENEVSYLLFLRLVPLFPFWLVNIAPAFFDVPLKTFAWTTFVGILPGVLVFTLAGSGLDMILESNEPFSINAIFNFQLKIALFILGITALIPVLHRKFKK